MKECKVCLKSKSLDDFYSTGKYKRAECKVCTCFIQAAGRFGLTVAELKQMYEDHNYACAICKQPCDQYPSLSIDHDHSCCPTKGRSSCGKCVRGLLCSKCNHGLGMFRENPEFLQSAIEYLRG